MAVFHVLKDGTRVDDISGHVVRFEDAETLYRFIHSINLKPTKTERLNGCRSYKDEV